MRHIIGLCAALLLLCLPGGADSQAQFPGVHDHSRHDSDAPPISEAMSAGLAQPNANASIAWALFPPPNPSAVTISVGESVTWNGDFSSHPLQSTDSTFTTITQTLAADGTTFSQAFLVAGTFYFRCGIHPAQMRTTVTVVAPGGAPVVSTAVSRRTHGIAGDFDLPLALTPNNPTTEPRRGLAQTIVITFDKAITGATAAISEGIAVATAPTFSGSDVVVGLTGVADQQYVTLTLTNVSAADGGTGGSASVRLGFLLGDVNQSRVVTLADLGMVNAQLAQPVTAANYLRDVNASGTLSLADKGLTNGNLTKALQLP